jgi:putative zinc finger protein
MSAESVPSRTHPIMWELIPWLVNGRLSVEEAASVSAHIAHCGECAGEYAQQLNIFEAMRADGNIAFASESAFRKLAARLDAAPAPPRTHQPVGWLAAASIVAALGLGAWGGSLLQRTPAGTSGPYLTLTAPAPVLRGGARLRVVFAPELKLSELERLLHSIDASISGGPTEAGVFTLTLAPERSSSTAVAQRLSALRADANVRFAEPVAGTP